jgi:hypothetical protein
MDVVSAYLLRFGITINPMKFLGAVSTLSQLGYFRNQNVFQGKVAILKIPDFIAHLGIND